ncbi:hypothetical protein [Luteibacter sp.]|jgi:hypothetical protein|uniref:hypothetical protein n=1 Tax=Luteibacter sp. TaxID=1886636 RepID=UPI002F3EB166
MALTPSAAKALASYCVQASEAGDPPRATIKGAVVLTIEQQEGITYYLSAFWAGDVKCPIVLDLKPQHGYRSRVLKDGFTGDQYAEWLAVGCSDVAEVSADRNGRPNLIVRAVDDGRRVTYDVMVPIRSTQDGYVHIDDVIPLGLPGKTKA